MHNHNAIRFPFSLVPMFAGTVVVLVVAYVALIAVVMSYAAVTVEFAQSVKDDEASVATLESRYLASVSRIENVDYLAAGYAAPVATVFVPSAGATALR